MKFRLFGLIAAFLMILAGPAFALDLSAARAQGLVGETPAGYIAAVRNTGDVAALVADVNARRRAEYARIAAENGQSVDIVARLAAEQIINGLESGWYYQGADGGWKKR